MFVNQTAVQSAGTGYFTAIIAGIGTGIFASAAINLPAITSAAQQIVSALF